MKKKILLIEDDQNLGFIIKDQLAQVGYEVCWCKEGNTGMTAFLKNKPDLCLLDVMLPKMDGFELSEKIRNQDDQTPILFLTARDMVEDRIKGFRSGGDDYITKPFSMEELLHRIRVFLNRSQMTSEKVIQLKNYHYKEVEIDFKKYELSISDRKRTLTEKETHLLELLIANKDRILKREEILFKLWGDDDYFMGRSLDVFISKLRKYLSDTDLEIKNYHGIGFKWEESN